MGTIRYSDQQRSKNVKTFKWDHRLQIIQTDRALSIPSNIRGCQSVRSLLDRKRSEEHLQTKLQLEHEDKTKQKQDKNGKKVCPPIPAPVRAWAFFGLARKVRPSPSLCRLARLTRPKSRVYRVTRLRTDDGVHCRESTGTDRASKPQGNSKRVLPFASILIYASISHTHYWYEVVIAC